MTNKHKGSTFESFLEEENLLEDVEAIAIKRVLTYELERVMQKNRLTKSEMAIRMHTSRSALDRLLDPMNTSITLHTLVKITHMIGKKFQFIIA